MAFYTKALNKAKSVAKKVVSKVKKVATSYGQKLLSSAKKTTSKVAPVVKKVVQSTPQYKAASTVAKAVSSSSSKKSSSSSKSSSNKSSGYSSKLSDALVTKTSAARSAPSSQKPAEPFNWKNLASVQKILNQVGQKFGSLGTPELGLSETLGGNKSSLIKAMENQPLGLPNNPFQITGLANPFGNVYGGQGLYRQPSQPTSYGSGSASYTPQTPETLGVSTNSSKPNTYPNPYQAFNQQLQSVGADPSKVGTGTQSVQQDPFSLPNPQMQSIPQEQSMEQQQQYSQDPLDAYKNEPWYGFVSETDAEQQVLLDQLNQQLQAGVITDQEALAAQEKIAMQRTRNQYDKLLKAYATMPEQYRASAESALQLLQSQMDMAYSQGAQSKQALENTYGEAIRRRLRNDQVSKNQLRNMFSSLGSAESSAFQEKMMDVESEQGRDIYQGEIEKAGKMSGIDEMLRNAENIKGTEQARIIRDRDNAINEVRSNQMMAEEEKAMALQEISLASMQALAQLQQQYQTSFATNGLDLNQWRQQLALMLMQNQMGLGSLQGNYAGSGIYG